MFSATSSTTSLRRIAALAFAGLFAAPLVAEAQTSNTFTACTQADLANCAVFRLTSQLNGGPNGLNLFEIAVRNLGSEHTPTLATTIYNLVFTTGQAEAPGAEIDSPVAPIAEGGAIVTDNTAWDVFDSGNAIFLSALSNNGVGNCIAGSAFNGYSQAGTTCDDQFLTFSFSTTRAYDPIAFVLSDYEVTSLSDPQVSDSCGDTTCRPPMPPVTATPEPGTLVLAMTGLCGVLGVGARRRRRHAAHGAA